MEQQQIPQSRILVTNCFHFTQTQQAPILRLTLMNPLWHRHTLLKSEGSYSMD